MKSGCRWIATIRSDQHSAHADWIGIALGAVLLGISGGAHAEVPSSAEAQAKTELVAEAGKAPLSDSSSYPGAVAGQPLKRHADGSISSEFYLEGKGPLTFFLDVDNATSSVHRGALTRFNIPHKEGREIRYTTYRGHYRLPSVTLDKLTSPVLTVSNPEFAKAPFALSLALAAKDGSLGTNILSSRILLYDIKGKMLLSVSPGIDLSEVYPHAYSTVSFSYDKRWGGLKVRGKVNGRAVRAILDPGTEKTFIDLRAANRIGLKFDRDTKAVAQIPGEEASDMFVAKGVSLEVGGAVWSDTSISIMAFPGGTGRYNMVIGTEHMEAFPFAIDYSKSEVSFLIGR